MPLLPPHPPQVRGGLTEKVAVDRTVRLRFTNVGKLPPPVLQFTQVTFGYSADKVSTAAVLGCSGPPVPLWCSLPV